MIFRKVEGEVRIALIATKIGTVWLLPKGLVEKGEPLEDVAVREVKEETGLLGRVIGKIDKLDHWFWWSEGGKKIRHNKVVHFFLIEYAPGDSADYDLEVDDVGWFLIDEAMEVISYKNEGEILSKAKEMIKSIL